MNTYLKDCVINYILKNNHRYSEEGFIIWLHEDYLRIKYNHKVYTVTVVEENEKLYWKLKPYNKSYYMTEIKEYSSFEAIIYAIKDNDKI